jgi:hypothetical protein
VIDVLCDVRERFRELANALFAFALLDVVACDANVRAEVRPATRRGRSSNLCSVRNRR